jgi:hypothetical protein
VSGLQEGVLAISAGGGHTCALLESHAIRCWGNNTFGALGLGEFGFASVPVATLESMQPNLAINHTTGQPGSHFTMNGADFPPNSLARLSVNGEVLTTALPVNVSGGFVAFIGTQGASLGEYQVTVSVNPEAAALFFLDSAAALHPMEGGGQAFLAPPGLAQHRVRLPFIKK